MRTFRLILMLPLALATVAAAQNLPPLAAPGLRVPASGSLPYALDRFEDKAELVPVHHSTVQLNNHKGANIAGSLAGSVFYKAKVTLELNGAHARTVLHAATPSFFLRVMDDPDSGPDDTPVYAILRVTPDKENRVFAKVQFTALTGNAKRNDGSVESTTEHLPGGWLKITPSGPLPNGEYVLTAVPKAQNSYANVVFDFAIDPAGANAADAVSAGAETE